MITAQLKKNQFFSEISKTRCENCRVFFKGKVLQKFYRKKFQKILGISEEILRKIFDETENKPTAGKIKRKKFVVILRRL